jgi:hypothetical protein
MSACQAVRPKAKVEIDLWHLMVWAYQRQCVIAETGRALADLEQAVLARAESGRSRDGVALALQIAELGTFIDGAAAGPDASRCHPDAELLHALVCSLPNRLARVLIEAAEMGEPPERCGFTPHWRRVARSGVNAGQWQAVATPDDLHRHPVYFRGRRCVRDDLGFHYEVHEETSLLWSPWCPVEEYPYTFAYARLVDAIADTFAEAMDVLACVVDHVEFRDHTVRRPV